MSSASNIPANAANADEIWKTEVTRLNAVFLKQNKCEKYLASHPNRGPCGTCDKKGIDCIANKSKIHCKSPECRHSEQRCSYTNDELYERAGMKERFSHISADVFEKFVDGLPKPPLTSPTWTPRSRGKDSIASVALSDDDNDSQSESDVVQLGKARESRIRALQREKADMKAQMSAMEETKHQSERMLKNLRTKLDDGKAKILKLQSDLEGGCSQAEKDSLTVELVVLRESLNKAEQKVCDQDQELLDTKKELQLQNERHEALAQANTAEIHDTQSRYEKVRQQFVALQKDHDAMRKEHEHRNMTEHFKISQMQKSLKTALRVSPNDARSLVSAVNMQLSMLEELADGRLSMEAGKWTTGSVNGNACPDLDADSFEEEGSARKKRKNTHTGFN